MAPTYTQKYTIVCFLDLKTAPITFSALDWPPHVTMLDTFKTEWPVKNLSRAIEQVAQCNTAFNIRATEQAMLGPDKDVPVKLLLPDAAIIGLHRKLLALSDEGSFIFNTPEFVGKGFLPHVTDQKASRMLIGKSYSITSVTLVDMFPDDDYMKRAIIKTFALK